MKKQKYQRGNLVKVRTGHIVHTVKDGKTTCKDIAPEQIGRKAIIQYSYNDEYGGGNIEDYSIMFMESGSTVAWKGESELEFINKGGEHLFKEAKENGKKLLIANRKKGKFNSHDYCTLIAWMVNCDNKAINFTDKTYTPEMIWHSNSHGELLGVYNAIGFVSACLKKQCFSEKHIKIYEQILKGDKIKPHGKYANWVGMQCLQLLYKTSSGFDKLLEKLLK